MILQDQAIALRLRPFGNTSRIVVWLTRHHGKLATLAKGSQRERSPLLGQVDLFYTCEILFYSREQRQLHVLKECAPMEWRPAFRSDWRACAAASYAAALMDQAMPVGPAPSGFFHLLEATLDQLSRRSPGPAFLLYLEWRLLNELGLAPRWDTCSRCRADLGGDAPARLDIAHGALRCGTCSGDEGRPVAPEVRRAIRHMLDGSLPVALSGRVFREIRDLSGGLLDYHADLHGSSRAIAFQILQQTDPAAGATARVS